MRWRLRLSEYRFAPKYKKGRKNQVADMLSRIPTDGGTNIPPDGGEDKQDDLPCFVPAANSKVLITDTGEETEDPSDTELGFPVEILSPSDEVLAVQQNQSSDLPDRISLEEMITEQSKDDFCQNVVEKLYSGEEIPFGQDPRSGLLLRLGIGSARLERSSQPR